MSSELITRDNFALSRPIDKAALAAPDDSTEFALNCKSMTASLNGLPADQSELVSRYLEANLADNSKRAYESDLRRFVDWGGIVPSPPELVAAYLASHAETHAVATLSRWLASISRAHEVADLPNSTRTGLVRRTLRGIRRVHGTAQKQARPLLREDLYRVLEAMGNSPRDIRDRALLLVGFEGAFRRSELSALDVGDLLFKSHGLVIHIRRSKTDQTSAGRKIGIPHRGGGLCPVSAIAAWLSDVDADSGPVFRRIDRVGRILSGRLSGEAASLILKRRAANVGLDSRNMSAHSLRAGFVTSASDSGTPLNQIAQQTGHTSETMVARYVRSAHPSESAPAPAKSANTNG